MKDDTYDLSDEHDLFYLCAVGQPDSATADPRMRQEFTNVHLAVRPKYGSVASVKSVYGVTFTITDAERIQIQALPDDFAGLPRNHARCKNFQFAYQMFAVTAVGKDAPQEIIRQLRSGAIAR